MYKNYDGKSLPVTPFLYIWVPNYPETMEEAENESIIHTSALNLDNKVVKLRGELVILDYHLAELYNTKTKVLNQSVKRNPELLKEDKHWFVITKEEKEHLKTLGASFEIKFNNVLPKAYTAKGVFMIPTIINSSAAKTMHEKIIDHYVFLLQKEKEAELKGLGNLNQNGRIEELEVKMRVVIKTMLGLEGEVETIKSAITSDAETQRKRIGF